MNTPHIDARCPTCGHKKLPVTSAAVFPNASPIARKLRRLRVKRGWSQKTLGKKSGYTKVAIGYWERGYRVPTKFNMQCWKDALGSVE